MQKVDRLETKFLDRLKTLIIAEVQKLHKHLNGLPHCPIKTKLSIQIFFWYPNKCLRRVGETLTTKKFSTRGIFRNRIHMGSFKFWVRQPVEDSDYVAHTDFANWRLRSIQEDKLFENLLKWFTESVILVDKWWICFAMRSADADWSINVWKGSVTWINAFISKQWGYIG